jgi:hypothetical protein
LREYLVARPARIQNPDAENQIFDLLSSTADPSTPENYVALKEALYTKIRLTKTKMHFSTS